jgi:hypothetical protein
LLEDGAEAESVGDFGLFVCLVDEVNGVADSGYLLWRAKVSILIPSDHRYHLLFLQIVIATWTLCMQARNC